MQFTVCILVIYLNINQLKNIFGEILEKVSLITSSKNWMEYDAVNQLHHIAKLEGVTKVVGFPDLHPGIVPVGMAVETKNRIYPHLIGNDIGCGMGFFMSDIKQEKFKLDKFEKRITEKIENNQPSYNDKNKNLGSIGGGNHFAEFQFVEKIFNNTEFEQTGISKNKVYLLVHSGSRNFGTEIYEKFHTNGEGIDLKSELFVNYMNKSNEACEWAIENREKIAEKLFNKLKNRVNFIKITDSVHNNISSFTDKKGTFFVHRKGASDTKKGLVIIAGSRGSLSYLVKTNTCVNNYLYSIAHGAGRKWSRSECKSKLGWEKNNKNVKVNKYGGRVICSDKKLLCQEAPDAYKNINEVINCLLEKNLIEVIASFKPMLTIKNKV